MFFCVSLQKMHSDVIKINKSLAEPVYHQIVSTVESAIRCGRLKPGEMLPSMNALAAAEGLSRETVKKAYGILTDAGMIKPHHGKGFYVADNSLDAKPSVLLIFDTLSIYKQTLFNALVGRLGTSADTTILTHGQSLDIFNYYLDQNLDKYDYYVVTPHFPRDGKSVERAEKLIKRIPNRKLIMADYWLETVPGNYGAVYQSFDQDAYGCFTRESAAFDRVSRLLVITLPNSLYGSLIHVPIRRFAGENGIPVEFLESVPCDLRSGDAFILLNSQLESDLVVLAKQASRLGMTVGRDIFVISYNEFPLNEVVLGGLTTISTDFAFMGRAVAEMILDRKMGKVHCPFRMTRRSTF